MNTPTPLSFSEISEIVGEPIEVMGSYDMAFARAIEQAVNQRWQEMLGKQIPVCNLWVNPITMQYEVDHLDHPSAELIPVYKHPAPDNTALLRQALEALEVIRLCIPPAQRAMVDAAIKAIKEVVG